LNYVLIFLLYRIYTRVLFILEESVILYLWSIICIILRISIVQFRVGIYLRALLHMVISISIWSKTITSLKTIIIINNLWLLIFQILFIHFINNLIMTLSCSMTNLTVLTVVSMTYQSLLLFLIFIIRSVGRWSFKL
jgi:hypothetical protein